MRNEVAQSVPINGPDRAAILLLSLGEVEAAEVLKHMGAKDVQRVGTAMAAMSGVTRDKVEAVLSEFANALGQQTSLGVGSDEYIRNMLVEALGQDKASSVVDRILLGRNSKGLEALKWMETRSVAELIRAEHPQIIAIVMAYLDSDQAAEILAYLPEKVQIEVMMRVATLDGIQPGALRELDEIMEKQFSGSGNLRASSVGGLKTAANIMNLVDGQHEEKLMTAIRERDNGLGDNIQDLMFVFDNLLEVDDRNIQVLLREIASDTLLLALKGADTRVRDKFLKNMSQRAADILREDMEAKGPVRVADAEGAQREILATARRLADEGTISLASGGGDEFV